MNSFSGVTKRIPIHAIQPNPRQPRQHFNQDEIAALAETIHEDGLLQLLKLEEGPDGIYYIRDGERRWRAVQLLRWDSVEAVIYPPESDLHQQRLTQALVANIHRADLNILEKGRAYAALLDDGMSMSQIARKFKTSATTASLYMDWLSLEPEIQDIIAEGKLPTDRRVYNALMTIPAGSTRVALVKRFARDGVAISTIEKSCKNFRQQLANARREEERKRILGEQASVKRENPKPTKKRGNLQPSTILSLEENANPPDIQQWTTIRQTAIDTCQACDVNPGLPAAPAPSWELVLLSAESTCQACSLNPKDKAAARSICGQCPVVDFLTRLAGERQ